jgi:hypothetical protein
MACPECPLLRRFGYSTSVICRLLLCRIANPRFVCSVLVIGMMSAATPAARAQDKPQEIKLEIKNPVEGDLALYHTIKVPVENLSEWAKQKGNDASKFRLNIDGTRFEGLVPALIENSSKLQFDLKRTADNAHSWTAVLSRRRGHQCLFVCGVPVTVEFENGVQVPSKAWPALTLVDKPWFFVFVFSFLGAIAMFWWLACKSDILRIPGGQPDGNKSGRPNRKPYSLARTQMAFWFFIVISSYVFIWMVTSDFSTLTAGVLGLIGISAATGLGAAVVDSGKRSDQENERRSLEEKKKNDDVEAERLKSEITALTAAVSATPAPANVEEQKATLAAKQAELAAKKKELEQTSAAIAALSKAAEPPVSTRFINDILSDDEGISFHRFQIFAWTIVLIIIFIGKVYNELSMPEFDATLLALMGISGGTYIGFKLPSQPG